MPSIIRQYVPQEDAPGAVNRPSQSGEAFGQQVAQEGMRRAAAMSEAGSEVLNLGQVLANREGEAESTKLAANLAKLKADATNDYQKAIREADPNDTTVGQRFLDNYQAKVDELGQTVNTRIGQQFFTKASAEHGAYFSELATKGQIELSGVQARKNFQDFLDAQGAVLDTHPQSYNSSLQDMRSMIGEMSSLNPEEKLRLEEHGRKTLVETAIRGSIFQDPLKAKLELESGKWDTEIDSSVKHTMISNAKEVIRGKRIDADLAAREADRALHNAQTAAMNDYIGRIFNPGKPTGDGKSNFGPMPTSLEINQSKILEPAQQLQMIGLLERKGDKDEIPHNPAAFSEALRKIHLPDDDPDKIHNEMQITQLTIDRILPWNDMNQLRQEYQGRRTTDGKMRADIEAMFFKKIAPDIDKSILGALDTEGPERFYNFYQQAKVRINQFEQSGKNVMDLFTKGNPNYLGNSVENFQPNTQQMLKTITERMQKTKEASGLLAPATPNGEPTLNMSDPKVQKALQQGYTPKQVQEYLSGKSKRK